MKIDVTQNDIDAGHRTGLWCPVALALNRQAGKSWWVGHDGNKLVLSSPERVEFSGPDVPDSVKRFIRRFDRFDPVKPFSFDLDVSVPFLRATLAIGAGCDSQFEDES